MGTIFPSDRTSILLKNWIAVLKSEDVQVAPRNNTLLGSEVVRQQLDEHTILNYKEKNYHEVHYIPYPPLFGIDIGVGGNEGGSKLVELSRAKPLYMPSSSMLLEPNPPPIPPTRR